MKIGVVGRGRSGKAAFDWLTLQGESPEFLDDVDGNLTPDSVMPFDALVLSPGVPRRHPAIEAAIKHNKPIYNEIELASKALVGCRFVGITGTNGKSTTTALLGHILAQEQPDVFVGGNLGRPLCEALIAGERPRLAVLELSSFQLETIKQLSLDVAILLNLTPDHLDRYDSAQHYYDVKKQIFELLKSEGVRIELPSSELPPGFKAPAKLIGTHNMQNIRAAVLAAQALGVSDAVIQCGLDSFPGIAHRLEILGEKNGVTWINDSKATTVESVLAALDCFSAGVHLILGGLGKQASYRPLVPACHGKVRAVYLIGQDAQRIEDAFAGHEAGINIYRAETLEKAVQLAFQEAVQGETVLLSPSCASYDQFKSFEDRGNKFRSMFHGL
ncbi:MAG: UDP-N-acetylmuramoyl-L-alanine--D-glutamate ligase [Myxococcota bacterium]